MFKQLVIGGGSLSLLLLAAQIQANTPNAPVISWMPADYQLQHGSVQVPVRWDMWWGSNGNKWYLHKNDSAVYSAALTADGQNAQSGSTTLTFTQPGSYQLQVSLCQVSGATEECAQSGITTITIGGSGGTVPDPVEPDPVEPDPVDPDPVEPAPTNPAAPAKPVFGWSENSVTLTGGSANLNLSWNMWWGNNGNLWQLKQNGAVVHSAALTANGQQAQSGSTSVNFSSTGNYNFVVSLCQQSSSALLCTDSDIKTVAVTAGSGGDNGGDGGFNPWTDLDMTAWPHPLKQSNQAYSNTTGKKVGAYFVEWGIYGRAFHAADIPAQNLTHIYYGFIPVCGANPSLQAANPQGHAALVSQCAGKPDYSVVVHDAFAALEKGYPGDVWDQPIRGIFAELYRLKLAHPHVKILPSVGGWTLSDPLYQVGVNPAARAVFIESMIDFIRTYDFFDGIDIDWEFPGGGGATPELGSPQDGAGFATLMRELREALDALSVETGRDYELAAAMSGGVQKLSVVDWEDAHQYMDYINLMTYDYYGAWNGVLGHQTGLYPSANSPISGFSADEAVQYLLNRGVPPDKIALGAAMYGRGWQNVAGVSGNNPFSGTGGAGIGGGWEPGIMDYKKIEADFMGGPEANGVNGFTVGWDDTAKASYVWNPATNTLISMDTKRSVREKGAYILQHQLGGIFAWEIDADNGHILNAMHEGLGHPQQ
ncbi:chitinase [Arsukibacterium ikkense]|uniref:chitinase n=1 Tax=Arsukibacterium ikkense TaxID=336831 RepID=A0A0M2V377_9GAMM|nr:glycosyl hydrolase family 18 protein [Arsukibacterium ikkense]KKO45096.1 chitinase [Arsukibacterium ikkense]